MTAQRAYKMRTVSRLTGFSPALLRAWERRHRLLAPRRTAGGHRLYTPDDLRILERVKELLDQGRSIGEIALIGREALLHQAPSEPTLAPSDGVGSGLELAVERICQAAAALDRDAVGSALDETFALGRVERVLGEVVEPALRQIGDLWVEGRCSVAGEHMACAALRARLTILLDAANPRPSPGVPLALVGCLPGELHEGGALLLSYHLARTGRHVVFLGGDIPLADLDQACGLLDPDEVHLSVAREEVLAEVRQELARLIRRRGRGGRPRFTVGGQGLTGEQTSLRRAGARLVPAPVRFAQLGAALAAAV